MGFYSRNDQAALAAQAAEEARRRLDAEAASDRLRTIDDAEHGRPRVGWRPWSLGALLGRVLEGIARVFGK
jgi:hypothetical protein